MKTKQSYLDFQKKVDEFLTANDIKLGCFSTDKPEFFSWFRCDCCKSPLGGGREETTFACNNGAKIKANICLDCVYYLTYGVLDDLSMLEVKDDEKRIDNEKAHEFEIKEAEKELEQLNKQHKENREYLESRLKSLKQNLK